MTARLRVIEGGRGAKPAWNGLYQVAPGEVREEIAFVRQMLDAERAAFPETTWIGEEESFARPWMAQRRAMVARELLFVGAFIAGVLVGLLGSGR